MSRIGLLFALFVVGVLGVSLTWAHWPHHPLSDDARGDRIVIRKSARVLDLYRGEVLLKKYRIALGADPIGPKSREGDHRTPEGRYRIDYRKADSSFHRALHISYPSVEDSARAANVGVNAGGIIMIHGIRNGLGWLGRLHRLSDWTDGCVAVSNEEIEELYRAAPDGTIVELRP